MTELQAWIQVLLTGAGIFAAVGVAAYNNREILRRENAAKLRKVQLHRQVAIAAVERMGNMARSIASVTPENRLPVSMAPAYFEALKRGIEEASITDVDDSELYADIDTVRGFLNVAMHPEAADWEKKYVRLAASCDKFLSKHGNETQVKAATARLVPPQSAAPVQANIPAKPSLQMEATQ